MILEHQVTSLILSQRLRELGVKQNSLFSYLRYDDGHEELVYGKSPKGNQYWTSAFTVAELGEKLGKTKKADFLEAYVRVMDLNFSDIKDIGAALMAHNLMTQPDMAAKMLVYLLENGLITL